MVEEQALEVVAEVSNALAAGKLKETVQGENTFWIEDPEKGDGLSIFKNKKNE